MFFRYLINSFSVWQLFLINFSILALISLLATYLGSLLISPYKIDHEFTRSTDSVLNILGSGYGIFLGFVIITLWNHYLNVQKIVYEEADAASALVRELEVFPAQDAQPLRQSIRDYLQAVRKNEWLTMRLGQESSQTWATTGKLYTTLQNFTPHNSKEEFYYRQLISHLDSMLKARRDRLIAAKSILNNELRTALILGAIVIVFLSSLLKSREGSLRIFSNLCLAMVLGFNLTLALNFNFPFSGAISVSDKPLYQGMLAKI
nr:DUF4239 domain-containing protein [Legionella jordanis]